MINFGIREARYAPVTANRFALTPQGEVLGVYLCFLSSVQEIFNNVGGVKHLFERPSDALIKELYYARVVGLRVSNPGSL